MSSYTGQCHCGQVQFEVSGPPLRKCICHCSQCRIAAGTNYIVAALYPLDKVEITQGEQNIKNWQNGERSNRGFCTSCGTRVWNRIEARNYCVIYYNTLSFNGFNTASSTGGGAGQIPGDMQIELHIYYTQRLAGVEYDDGIVKYDTTADAKTTVEWNAPVDESKLHAVEAPKDGQRSLQCGCGKIQAKVASPTDAYTCYCSLCRTLLPGEYAHFGGIKRDELHFTAGEDLLKTYTVNSTVKGFCSECGVWIYMTDKSGEQGYSLSVSVMDFSGTKEHGPGQCPADWKPQMQIYYGSRLKGHEFDLGAPLHVGGPDSERCDFHGNKLDAK